MVGGTYMIQNETPKEPIIFKPITIIPNKMGYYQQILEDFLEQEHPLVEVLIEGKPFYTVYSGLQHASSLHSEYREKIKIKKSMNPKLF